MKDLIKFVNQGQNFMVDSRDLAKLFNVTHEHLRESIESHQNHLEQLGVFRVETGKPLKATTGGRPEKYYWLSVDQAMFLLTITRSSEETNQFRVKLILAFRSATERMRPVDTLLLSIPEIWRKTFKDEFYMALLRIYGESFNAARNKPSWVGAWTNRFIYAPIYQGLSDELKSKRAAYCGTSGKDPEFIRLHQFLEKHAKQELREQIAKTTAILQVSASKHEFAENYRSVFHGFSQIKFDDLLDGDFGNN